MTSKPCDHRYLLRSSIKEFFICKNSSFASKTNKCTINSDNLYNSSFFSSLITNTVTDHQPLSQYLSLRKTAVVLLKTISSSFSLCDKTFHLSVLLLDRIYSKINSFTEINFISVFCLILAAKFTEDDASKASLLQKSYSRSLSLIQYNFVLPLSPLQIALGVIQIARKKIGLPSYTNELIEKFELSDKENIFKEAYSSFAKVLNKKRRQEESKCLVVL